MESNGNDQDDDIMIEDPGPSNRVEEAKEVVKSEDDDIIVEKEKVLTEEEQIELKCNRIDQMLSWFLKMKPQFFDDFAVNRLDYLTHFVSDHLAVDIRIARGLLDEFQKTGSVEDLYSEHGLSSEALAIVAICMVTLDESNKRDIEFTSLCDDRVDKWAFDVLDRFMNNRNAGTEKNTPAGPLELVQAMYSPPAYVVLGLTVLWLQLNDFPCRVEWAKVENFSVSQEEWEKWERAIADHGIQLFQENKKIPEPEARFPKESVLTVDELIKVEANVTTDLDKLLIALGDVKLIKTQLAQEVVVEEVSPPDDMSFLSEEERKQIEMINANLEECKQMMEVYRQQHSGERKETAKTLHEALVIWPGEYCLARRDPCDLAEFYLAVCEDQVNDSTYRVKFVDDGAVMGVNIRDLAYPRLTMLDPMLSNSMFIGLRVACYVSKINPITRKPRSGWYSGTIGGRPVSHGHEFLIFLDDMEDVYIPQPNTDNPEVMKAVMMTDIGNLEQVQKKLEVVKIVPIIVQAFDELMNLDRSRVVQLIRDKNKNRKRFIQNFMIKYPEWPLLRVKVGTSITVADGNTKVGRSVNIVSTDRAFCVIRAIEKPGSEGYGCTTYPCTVRSHIHRDERLYRGSYKIPAVEVDRTDDNNLSKRSRDRHRRQFDNAEPKRVLPTEDMMDNKADNEKSRNFGRGGPTQKEREISDSEVAARKAKQNIIIKTKNFTPVLVPLKELRYHERCGSECVDAMDTDPYDPRFHACSPLHAPLMCGWRRMKIVGLPHKKRQYRAVLYYGPCGKPLRDFAAIQKYLRDTRSMLTIDCFSFDPELDTETYVTCDPKYVKTKDYAEGIEGIPIPAVNTIDNEDPPKIEYMSRRFQYDETVDISTINRGFCSGCSCEGDCSDASKCECQQLTMSSYSRLPERLLSEYKKFTGLYNYKNLLDKVAGGIYECNDNCSCQRKTCNNRVVQEGIKFPMQLFKTAESGWGVRALCDIPQGAFVCNYVGAVLTDSLADSMNNEDQYFADLDLKDYVEKQKIVHDDDDDDEKDGGFEDDDKLISSCGSAEEDDLEKLDDEDENSMEGVAPRRSIRQIEKKKQDLLKKKQRKEERKARKSEVVFKWGEYFEGGSLFVIDAKHRGNIGRYFNHSCEPNMQVQHVLYDTHDLRLPWAAFFTTQLIKAGEEMSWDYNYEFGDDDTGESKIQCKCGSKNCRKKLL